MPSVLLPGGGRLAYREAGSGAPVVLVHGSPGEGRAWSRVAQRLAERRRVLMPNLPGYRSLRARVDPCYDISIDVRSV